MCIAAWIWQAHPVYQLILVFNRDELLARPTSGVGWWGWGSKEILGGRDMMAGGTWMACTRDGRVAFLTNVMEPDTDPHAKSRGDLPLRFLESTLTATEFADELVAEAHLYNGFNLILADLGEPAMVYISNRPRDKPATVQVVAPGLHVLTNARLDTPWPKAQRLYRNFRRLLSRYRDSSEIPVQQLVKELMNDRVRASRDRLPNTGCDLDFELRLSSIFVEADAFLEGYLTRSQAALAIRRNGEAIFYERYLDENMWKEHAVDYQIEKKLEAAY